MHLQSSSCRVKQQPHIVRVCVVAVLIVKALEHKKAWSIGPCSARSAPLENFGQFLRLRQKLALAEAQFPYPR